MTKGYVGIAKTYTPVEYLQSTGVQYIDTGIVKDITKVYRIVGDFNYSDIQTRQLNGTQGSPYFGVVSGYYQVAQGGTNHTSIAAVADTYVDFDITFNCPAQTCTATINNQTETISSIAYGTNPIDSHFCIFALNNCYLPSSQKTTYWKLYVDNVLVRDFIPVKDENGVGCLYEQVEGKLYYNQGQGVFGFGLETGNTVNLGELASKIKDMYVGIITTSSYTPVDYIESTGIQYIDTGFKPNNNTRVVFDFSPTSVTSSWSWPFGGRNGYHNADYVIAYATSKWYSSFGTTDLQPSATITANTEYLIDKNKNVTTINGTSYTNSAATFQSNYNLLLLGVSDGATRQQCSAKLYSCQIYDNGELIRDFIPVLDQDGVACLFDKENDMFYYNQGVGVFSYGETTQQEPIIVFQTPKARKIVKGYVGVNGVAKLVYPFKLDFRAYRINKVEYPHYGGMTNTKNYVVHAGGYSGSTMATLSEFFDKNGTKFTSVALAKKRICMGVASFCGCAFFCGGSTVVNNWNMSNDIECFNNNMVRNATGVTMSTTNYGAQAYANGEKYLLTYGGNGNYSANFFSPNFTRTSASISNNGSFAIGGIGGNIIIAGGYASGVKKAVISYDGNCTKTTLSDLPSGVAGPTYASIKDYFIFAGGSTSSYTDASTAGTIVYVWDKNLVRTTATSLTDKTLNTSGSDFNKKYAIFPIASNVINIYDETLTRSFMSVPIYSYEWGGYGRNAGSIEDMMLYNSNGGEVMLVKGE